MNSTAWRASPLWRRLCATAHAVGPEDLAAAAHVMASAFSDDPSIRYLLGGQSMGCEDWKYFDCILKSVHGKCAMLSTSGRIHDLLVLLPPPLHAIPARSFFANGGFGLCSDFGWGLVRRSLRYEKNCRAMKKRFATPRTWYCLCLAVSPLWQGRGLASRLLRPVLDALDSHQASLYLETHKPKHVSMYTHLGFETVDRAPIPGTDIMQYAMMRRQPPRTDGP
ncbi:MAG TPA: GNAT family N-acetyltransferase [Candidatus Avichristensenella intestinipullorum]|uniref:GNAT family N-acetyltransferase n=1 Tax=Candidatus Avichristensenella intestinipullorum TaxID=2840693 RepID=A0A9D0YZK7_9FIRM|nr:GNAT family N-acetyltransferase [Candidatus Avichristensenella intestinipullorum]